LPISHALTSLKRDAADSGGHAPPQNGKNKANEAAEAAA